MPLPSRTSYAPELPQNLGEIVGWEETAKARSKIKAELCLRIPGLAQLVFHGGAVFVVLEPVSGEGLGGVGAVGVLVEAGQMGDGVAVHFAFAIAVHFLLQKTDKQLHRPLG